MAALAHEYFKTSLKKNHQFFTGNRVFLLKELLAFVVLITILAVVSATLWFAFTRSIYLVVVFFAIVGIGSLSPYLLTRPMLHPRRILNQCTPSDFDITNWESVRFHSIDSIELQGWFVPPSAENNGATIVFVHGLGANRSQLLSQATVMISRGYGALLFDLRNHGSSLGTLTTLGYTEANDVIAAINYARSRPEVNRERIGLIGYSMGAAAALRAAARLSYIQAVVAESTYTSLQDNITQGIIAKTGLPPFPFAPIMIWFGEHMTGLHINQIRPIDDVANITQPILFLHGEQDKTVDLSNSRRLHESAKNSKGLYIIKNAGHADLLRADPVGFDRHVVTFFDHYLKNSDTQDLSQPA